MFDQSPAHGVEVDVIETLTEFLGMTNKAVPKLVLPARTICVMKAVELERRNSLHVLSNRRNGYRKSWPNQSVPMVRHQDIAAKEESETLSCFPNRFKDGCIVRLGQVSFTLNEVGRDEEDFVG